MTLEFHDTSKRNHPVDADLIETQSPVDADLIAFDRVGRGRGGG